MPIVTDVPPKLKVLLKAAAAATTEPATMQLEVARPAYVRTKLRGAANGWETPLSLESSRDLLAFCLSDVTTSDQLAEAVQLPLLHLRDGSRTRLAHWNQDCPLLLCSEEDLRLRPRSDRVLLCDPGSELYRRLEELMSAGILPHVTLLHRAPMADLPSLLLPPEWRPTPSQPTPQPMSELDDAPCTRSMSELLHVWDFLADRHSSGDVAAFAGWPLLPGADGKAYPLSADGPNDSKVVQLPADADNHLARCLQQLGFVALNPRVDEHFGHRRSTLAKSPHPQLDPRSEDSCVPLVTVSSVVSAMLPLAASSSPLSGRIASADALERRALRKFFAGCSGHAPLSEYLSRYRTRQMQAQVAPIKQLVATLPIFETYASDHFTPLLLFGSQPHLIPPVDHGLPSSLLGPHLLREEPSQQASQDGEQLRDEDKKEKLACEELLELLGAERAKVASLYLDLLPSILQLLAADRDRLLRMILSRSERLKRDDAAGAAHLHARLRATKFVPSEDGELHAPSDLFHPELRSTPLGEALDQAAKDSLFPAANFTGSGGEAHLELSALEGLELRRFLTRKCILSIVRRVVSDAASSDPAAVEAAKAVAAHALQYISANGLIDVEGESDDMSAAEFCEALLELEWLPVRQRQDISTNGMPWPLEPIPPLAAPCHVRPHADSYCMSANARVLEPTFSIGESLSRLFGWDQPVKLTHLLKQLQAFSREASASSTDVEKLFVTLNDALTAYADPDAELSQEDSALLRSLKADRSIYLGAIDGVPTRFVTPRQVAMTTNGLDLQPHLFKTPPYLRSLEAVVSALGVRDSFERDDFRGAMRQAQTAPFLKEPPRAKLLAVLNAGREEDGRSEDFMSRCA